MGDQAVIYVNTALLIFITGLLIGFARWLVLRLHAMDLVIKENCIEIREIKITATKSAEAACRLELGLAVHAASPHCGEEA